MLNELFLYETVYNLKESIIYNMTFHVEIRKHCYNFHSKYDVNVISKYTFTIILKFEPTCKISH